MTGRAQPGREALMLLTELAEQPNVTRTALELAIRTGKLTPIARHGQIWLIRTEAETWLSWRASTCGPSAPVHQFEL